MANAVVGVIVPKKTMLMVREMMLVVRMVLMVKVIMKEIIRERMLL